MRVEKILIFFSMFVLLLAACTPSAVSGPTPGSAQSEPPAQVTTAIGETPAPSNVEKTAVNAAIAALMQEVKVDATQVKIAAVEAVDWPNACLGAAKPDEMCAEVVTPGYKIMLQAGEKTYEYHTNQDGSQIRGLSGTTSKDAPSGGAQSTTQAQTPAASIPAPAKAAQQALAKQLGVAADQVRIASVEQVDWPDGCLGIQRPGIMCTQIIVPGYRVILEASGKQYEFRTDESGSQIDAAGSPLAGSAEPTSSAPLPQITGVVVGWEQAGNAGCHRVEIGTQNVSYGTCGGTLKETPLSSERAKELEFFLSTYEPFTQETKAGKVDFKGAGSHAASEAEMRSIAEWAAVVYQEAQSGRSDAANGLAFNWHREGGFAGFCDDLTVYRTGWALPRSCKNSSAQAPKPYRLSPGELEKLYAYIDQLGSLNYEHKDSAAADAMLVRLSLAGSGAQQAAPAQQEEVASFAAQVYANAMNR